MFGLTTFATSGALIVGLFALRYFEMNRGSRFFPRFRKTLDYLSLLFVRYVVKEFPKFVSRMVQYVILHVTHLFSIVLLKMVQFIEGRLHIAVHKVRGKKDDLAKSEPTSNHLTDMQNHKREVGKTIEELEEVQ